MKSRSSLQHSKDQARRSFQTRAPRWFLRKARRLPWMPSSRCIPKKWRAHHSRNVSTPAHVDQLAGRREAPRQAAINSLVDLFARNLELIYSTKTSNHQTDGGVQLAPDLDGCSRKDALEPRLGDRIVWFCRTCPRSAGPPWSGLHRDGTPVYCYKEVRTGPVLEAEHGGGTVRFSRELQSLRVEDLRRVQLLSSSSAAGLQLLSLK